MKRRQELADVYFRAAGDKYMNILFVALGSAQLEERLELFAAHRLRAFIKGIDDKEYTASPLQKFRKHDQEIIVDWMMDRTGRRMPRLQVCEAFL